MTGTENASGYVAEFADGPLKGSIEERPAVQGTYEQPLRVLITVDGLPSIQTYDAVGSRMRGEKLWVEYRFAKDRSDASTVDACRPNWAAEGIQHRPV